MKVGVWDARTGTPVLTSKRKAERGLRNGSLVAWQCDYWQASCPWCRNKAEGAGTGCICRYACGNHGCPRLDSSYASELEEGMCVYIGDSDLTLTVAAVTDPGADRMVIITTRRGDDWHVPADMLLDFADPEEI